VAGEKSSQKYKKVAMKTKESPKIQKSEQKDNKKAKKKK